MKTINHLTFNLYNPAEVSYCDKDAISVIIPSTIIDNEKTYKVEYIETDSFNLCLKLKEVEIPNTIRYIGYNAFCHCISLKTITLPENIDTIRDCAFALCNNLETIVCLAKTPPLIGDRVFENISPNATLRVPKESLNTYKYSSWGKIFKKNIVEI